MGIFVQDVLYNLSQHQSEIDIGNSMILRYSRTSPKETHVVQEPVTVQPSYIDYVGNRPFLDGCAIGLDGCLCTGAEDQ
jgi:hypothetical protein